jgi:hypothetical protein
MRDASRAKGAATKLRSAPNFVSASAVPPGKAAVAKKSATVKPIEAATPTTSRSPNRRPGGRPGRATTTEDGGPTTQVPAAEAAAPLASDDRSVSDSVERYRSCRRHPRRDNSHALQTPSGCLRERRSCSSNQSRLIRNSGMPFRNPQTRRRTALMVSPIGSTHRPVSGHGGATRSVLGTL